MSERVQVHMIGNAHLDPVWLWSWQAGVDEALATADTAVKLLDQYPEFVFTRSDVWFHETVEQLNPELFDHIKQHVAQGRWQLVGGWYIQPDCNLPTEFGFRKHFQIGKKYFQDRFGKTVTIGYNPDSFGHAGSLPRLLAENGYHSYIYMRPNTQEKEYGFNSQVFWWEAADSNHRVLAYRIPGAYCCTTAQLAESIKTVIAESDSSLGHLMCFYGVGDHGGGPTRRQIEFILENKTTFEGYELVLSHPQAYFDAIRGKTDALPVAKGELQHHAVGCYTVLHRIKRDLHAAEHRLAQAQALVERFPDAALPGAADRIEGAWKDVLFNQFHDTYGGTCLKTAYNDLFDQIGRARAVADQEATALIRRYSRTMPRLELGEKKFFVYFAALNAHHQDYTGWLEHEIFGADRPYMKFSQITGKTSREVSYQRIRNEAGVCGPPKFLLPVQLKAGEVKVFSVSEDTPDPVQTDIRTNHDQIGNNLFQVRARPTGLLLSTTTNFTLNLTWQVFEDLSDTWSHGRVRLGDRHIGAFTQDKLLIEESGPIRACLSWVGDFLHSRIRVQAKIYREEKWLDLAISLLWNQPKTMVKMVLEPKEPILERKDGMPGGVQARDLDGREYPFGDWTLLTGRQNQLAFISPDVFGFDVQKENARFTLVRSPAYSFHDPAKMEENRYTYDYIDIGEHEYRILLSLDPALDPKRLTKLAAQIQQPLIHWDPPYRDNYPQG